MSEQNQWMPVEGGAYLCLKGSKERSVVKGKVYVYQGRQTDDLIHYNSRWQTLVLNGWNALRQPGAFQPAGTCPICEVRPLFNATGELVHNAVECERARFEAARQQEREADNMETTGRSDA